MVEKESKESEDEAVGNLLPMPCLDNGMRPIVGDGIKLFVAELFLGPLEIKLNTPPVIHLHRDDLSSSGTLLISTLRRNSKLDMHITLKHIENITFCRNTHGQRPLMIIRTTQYCGRSLLKKLELEEAMKKFTYKLPVPAERDVTRQLVLFLHAQSGVVCETDRMEQLTFASMSKVAQLVQRKRNEHLRYVSETKPGKAPHFNYVSNFWDEMGVDHLDAFLKRVGIRCLPSKEGYHTYKGAEPIPSSSEEKNEHDKELRNGQMTAQQMGYDEDTPIGTVLGMTKRGKGLARREPPKSFIQEAPRPVTRPSRRRTAPVEVVSLDEDEDVPTKRVRNTELVKFGTVTLNFDDMKGLWHNEMLNDSVVDIYLQYMKAHICDDQLRSRVHIMSPFFYKRLTDNSPGQAVYQRRPRVISTRKAWIAKNFESVRNWTKKVNIFDLDYLFVPVVDDLHWYLVVIVQPFRCVVKEEESDSSEPATYAIIMDSLVDRNDQKRVAVTDILRDYLELEFEDKKKLEGRFDRNRLGEIRPKDVPQQTNYTDCGIYVLAYAEEFLRKPPTDLRPNVTWYDWYKHTRIRLSHQRLMIARNIESMCSRERLLAFRQYDSEKRAERDADRIEDDVVATARRHRYRSECRAASPVPPLRRAQSEPPSSSTIPQTLSFH